MTSLLRLIPSALKSVTGLRGAAKVSQLQTASGYARDNMGESSYQKTRGNALTAYSAWSAFSPFNPLNWPSQITLLIFYCIIIMYVCGQNSGTGFLLSYLAMGITQTYRNKWWADKQLSYGFGI